MRDDGAKGKVRMKKHKKGTFWTVLGLLLLLGAAGLSLFNVLTDRTAGAGAATVMDSLHSALPETQKAPLSRQEVLSQALDEGSSDSEDASTEGETDAALSVREDRSPISASELLYPDYLLDPDRDMPVVNVDGNDYVGYIAVPELDLELPVLSEWSYPNLKISPCRYRGTVYKGDLVLCAHNYTSHFGNLKTLQPGAVITFTDMDGYVFTYRVVELEVLRPSDVGDMITGDWDLTLFTCTVGGRTRMTVRCELVTE